MRVINGVADRIATLLRLNINSRTIAAELHDIQNVRLPL